MQDWFTYIIIIGVLALIIAVVIFLVYRSKKQVMHGRSDNSRLAVSKARSFARSNSFVFISPANLVRGEKSAHLDAIVVGYFGVLGIKALGYNGEIYGSLDEKDWLQVAGKGERNRFANPIIEAAADVRVIRDALFSAKLKQVPVEVVCVFTSRKAQLALPRNTGHYTMKEFKSLLAKDKYMKDAGYDLTKVENAIRASLAEQSH